MNKSFNEVAAVKGYHIHIYFETGKDSASQAQELMEDIKTLFPADIESAAKIGRIGPHTKENFALHIKKDGFATIIPWVQLNSRDLSILIHPDRNDDIIDHLGSSMWLGEPVKYNDGFFAKLKKAQEKDLAP